MRILIFLTVVSLVVIPYVNAQPQSAPNSSTDYLAQQPKKVDDAGPLFHLYRGPFVPETIRVIHCNTLFQLLVETFGIYLAGVLFLIGGTSYLLLKTRKVFIILVAIGVLVVLLRVAAALSPHPCDRFKELVRSNQNLELIRVPFGSASSSA